ncbi:tyrosine-type recombinase/integrase [Oscillatoria sp. FACHB-1406]|uniref:tyrosine-type recombinase/integrase n=1 Tax=Oscillatoria sp. FACHB-1406 TaxID=2692846 RepID=UPI0016862BD6|nr:tyrosine-type recombinase/integrase [Oscillatoria sp. FACHB-1406]MBD2578129.1 tyrosine-type recombinase/integrase [Oscillatoria sp. FACHB-1406]
MYSTDRTQSPHGQCSVISVNGTLQVNFPRSLFGGKRKRLALGLKDTPENRIEAEKRIKAIQTDIDFGQFDLTLERYKQKYKQKAHLEKVQSLFPETTLGDLYDRYLGYLKPTIKETTYIGYTETFPNKFQKSPIKSPYQALEFRQWLLDNYSESMTKRVLTHTNAAFKWGLKHGIVKGQNPYEGITDGLKHKYEEDPEPNPFTQEEKQYILEEFKNHRGNYNSKHYTGIKYCHYLPFVKFMFLSGCRPGEAVGLRWGDISPDMSRITFNGGLYNKNGKWIKTKGSKNNKKRTFPCNEELRQFLLDICPESYQSDNLVFLSPKGNPIRYSDFSRRAWNKIVDPIKPGTTPYCCRDTFISEQIAKGISSAIVAKWCDTSTAMIEKHYLGDAGIAHIVPM